MWLSASDSPASRAPDAWGGHAFPESRFNVVGLCVLSNVNSNSNHYSVSLPLFLPQFNITEQLSRLIR